LKTKGVGLSGLQKRTENELKTNSFLHAKNSKETPIRTNFGERREAGIASGECRSHNWLNPNSEVARLCGTKPLTRLATLATLSPRERAEINHRRLPSPRGTELKSIIVDAPLPWGETEINHGGRPSPLGRGCPEAGVVISRCGTGEGLLPKIPNTRPVLEVVKAGNSHSTSWPGNARPLTAARLSGDLGLRCLDTKIAVRYAGTEMGQSGLDRSCRLAISRHREICYCRRASCSKRAGKKARVRWPMC